MTETGSDNTWDHWHADPWVIVPRDVVEWYEGLFATAERWRALYLEATGKERDDD